LAARVRAALRAEAERLAALRLRETRCAWRESARCEAARRGIFFNARIVARARVPRDSLLGRRRAAARLPVLRLPELRLPVLRVERPPVVRADRLRLPELCVDLMLPELRVDRLLPELRVDLLLPELRVDLLLPELRVDLLLPELRVDLLLLDRFVLRRDPVLRLAPDRLAPDRLAPELRREDEATVRVPLDLRGLRDDFADDLRFGFSGMSTPARRASESPIAMACRAFFAPCSPSRILSISRSTNSPACVLADLPARLSARARSMVSLSGIECLQERWGTSLLAIIVPGHEQRFGCLVRLAVDALLPECDRKQMLAEEQEVPKQLIGVRPQLR
jgi:hypothetical protein